MKEEKLKFEEKITQMEEKSKQITKQNNEQEVNTKIKEETLKFDEKIKQMEEKIKEITKQNNEQNETVNQKEKEVKRLMDELKKR